MSDAATDTFTISRTGKATILKDPDATLDYTIDWTDWLTSTADVDSLVMVDFDVTPDDIGTPIVNTQEIINEKLAIAWVSGGVPGVTYGLRCRITTAGGRIDDRTVYLKIKER